MSFDPATLAMAKKRCGGSTETKVLFDGKPTKLDLTSMGMGYAYQLSTEDLVTAAESLDVHYEYEVDGQKHSGVLETVVISAIGTAYADGVRVGVVCSPSLGCTGLTFSEDGMVGDDVGEITHLKLWTAYNSNEPYYLRYALDGGTNEAWMRFSHERAVVAAKKGLLFVWEQQASRTSILAPVETIHWNINNELYVAVIDANGDAKEHVFDNGVFKRTA